MSIKSLYPDTRPSLNLDFANTKVLDPRITFARASTATFYDGRTTSKAEENLITESQTLNGSSWQSLGMTTISGGQTAPDGTSTAFAFTENTVNETHRTFKNSSWVSGRSYTISFFAKYANRRYVQLNASSFSNSRVIFDIQNGTVTDPSGAVSTSVVNFGNGWYRFSATITATSTVTGSFPIGGNNGSTGNVETYTGNGLLAYYLWGVQVEERSGVTAYTPTTTQPITRYQPTLLTAPIGTPRFDHNPTTGESLGLLIEEQRTNLRTGSENFTLWGTGGDRVTIVANTAISPAGTLTANSYLEQANQKSWRWQEWAYSFTSGQPYTLSCFVKPGTATYGVILFLSDNGVFNGLTATFNLNTGVVSATGQNITATITSHGNGWYRISATQTAGASTTGYLAIGFSYSADFQTSPTGNAYNTLGYVWGAQVELGSFPTSYIPTVASQVTRSADSASMTGTNFSSWYNQEEGSLYTEVRALAPTTATNRRLIFLSSSIDTYAVELNFGAGTNSIVASRRGLGANVLSMISNPTKCAFAWNMSGSSLSVDAQSVNTSSGTSTQRTFDALQFGQVTYPSADGTAGNICIKKLAYYPKRLTNSQLQNITTP